MFEIIGERIKGPGNWFRQLWRNVMPTTLFVDVKKQEDADVTYVDVNAGAGIGHETEDMKWLLDTMQPIVTIPLALDSDSRYVVGI